MLEVILAHWFLVRYFEDPVSYLGTVWTFTVGCCDKVRSVFLQIGFYKLKSYADSLVSGDGKELRITM